MRQSKLFAHPKKELPAEAESVSHRLLLKGDYIDQLAAGVYALLPLGWRVHDKIVRIIRREMDAIGGQEIQMNVLQPKALWEETGRWDAYIPPLFKFKDQHGRELALAPTHEEQVTDLARRRVSSYRDLPFALYQIQTKFRNEARATGGLLRTREFAMKDLYSFHATEEDFGQFYEVVKAAYLKIFSWCGLQVRIVEAATGSIGGTLSHEFMFLAETGEDKILTCQDCSYAVNTELVQKLEQCPKCGGVTQLARAIEGSHVFRLGDKYSRAMNALFVDEAGERKPIIMGCYGIGIGRLLATIVEARHAKNAIHWPASVAPFDAHILVLSPAVRAVAKLSESLYAKAQKLGLEVIIDDRPEASAGAKFADADLIGAPLRVVVSEKTIGSKRIEIRNGFERGAQFVTAAELLKLFKQHQRRA